MHEMLDSYIKMINKEILPYVDFKALQRSYETADSYAKNVLYHLHKAMIKAYGSETLICDYGEVEDNCVVIPGVIKSPRTGQICLALLELDIASSGEHWQTHFLCQYGVIPQVGNDMTRDLVMPILNMYIP